MTVSVVGSGAWISADERYRYLLWRATGSGHGELVWVMLNPSTAGAVADDATVRRVVSFTRREGYGTAVVMNLYALRTPWPRDLRRHPDPVGPFNDRALEWYADRQFPIVCAWGAGGGARAGEVLRGPLACAELYCLGTTSGGHPRHPLYVRGDQPLVPFRAAPGGVNLAGRGPGTKPERGDPPPPAKAPGVPPADQEEAPGVR